MDLAAPNILNLLIFVSSDKGAGPGILSADRFKGAQKAFFHRPSSFKK